MSPSTSKGTETDEAITSLWPLLKRVYYFVEGSMVLCRGWCATLKRVVWYFEEGIVLTLKMVVLYFEEGDVVF